MLACCQAEQTGTCADGCHVTTFLSPGLLLLVHTAAGYRISDFKQTDPGNGLSLATWRWPEGSVVCYRLLGMHKTMSRPTTGAPLSGHEGFGMGPSQKPTVSVLTVEQRSSSREVWEHAHARGGINISAIY